MTSRRPAFVTIMQTANFLGRHDWPHFRRLYWARLRCTDRVYATPPGVAHVLDGGGDVIVRLWTVESVLSTHRPTTVNAIIKRVFNVRQIVPASHQDTPGPMDGHEPALNM